MTLRISVLTPDCVFRNREVDELILPTSTGQIGVLDNHAPIITALDIGPLIFRQQSNWISFALMGGFALVRENQVTILVNEAIARSSICLAEVEKELEKATDCLNQATGEKRKLEATLSFKRSRALYQVVRGKY